MVYMPLLPNERAVPDFDPSTAKFSGSYNLVWTPEQIDMLVNVCKQNYLDSEATLKDTLKEVWMRKINLRKFGGMSVHEQQSSNAKGSWNTSEIRK